MATCKVVETLEERDGLFLARETERARQREHGSELERVMIYSRSVVNVTFGIDRFSLVPRSP